MIILYLFYILMLCTS